jgi:hypothetical protein
VGATPIPDAVVDVHLHHAMRAYFSATDDRDETARRVYGVIGRPDSQQPEIALRVATGCKLRAVEPVPFAQVFSADLGDLRNVPSSATRLMCAGPAAKTWPRLPVRDATVVPHSWSVSCWRWQRTPQSSARDLRLAGVPTGRTHLSGLC